MTVLPGRILFFVLLWWVLAGGTTAGWPFGAVAVVLATYTSAYLRPAVAARIRLLQLPVFVAYFVVNSVRGGWQVALMALRGRAVLRPAIIDLPLVLPAGAAQILFTNALCMMPGTVGMQLGDAGLRVHVLDARLPVAATARALEHRVAALFGVRLDARMGAPP